MSCGRKRESFVRDYFKYDAVTDKCQCHLCQLKMAGKAPRIYRGICSALTKEIVFWHERSRRHSSATRRTEYQQSLTTAKSASSVLWRLAGNLCIETPPQFLARDRSDIFPRLRKAAEDLNAAIASLAFSERVFSLCSDLSTGKRNRASVLLQRQVILKPNKPLLLMKNYEQF
jgi:hypothetical protein